jgi:hypothetical protein
VTSEARRALRNRIDAIVRGPRDPPTGRAMRGGPMFSPYVDDDMQRATELASHLMAVADSRPGIDGLGDAVAEMEAALGREMPGLVPYAVKLFLTHWPNADRLLADEKGEQL